MEGSTAQHSPRHPDAGTHGQLLAPKRVAREFSQDRGIRYKSWKPPDFLRRQAKWVSLERSLPSPPVPGAANGGRGVIRGADGGTGVKYHRMAAGRRAAWPAGLWGRMWDRWQPGRYQCGGGLRRCWQAALQILWEGLGLFGSGGGRLTGMCRDPQHVLCLPAATLGPGAATRH